LVDNRAAAEFAFQRSYSAEQHPCADRFGALTIDGACPRSTAGGRAGGNGKISDFAPPIAE
jgi:hypothetical protein